MNRNGDDVDGGDIIKQYITLITSQLTFRDVAQKGLVCFLCVANKVKASTSCSSSSDGCGGVSAAASSGRPIAQECSCKSNSFFSHAFACEV